jgi:hypothetical protein
MYIHVSKCKNDKVKERKINKWIKHNLKKKKMWHLYTIEFYSAVKKNEILSFADKWMETEEHHFK